MYLSLFASFIFIKFIYYIPVIYVNQSSLFANLFNNKVNLK